MELKKEIESLLFSSGKTMTEEELSELTGNSKAEVKEALISLKAEYDSRDTSLMLVQSGESWKLNVREKYMNPVTKIVADTELPFPVLETLAVIAYKAPVLQAEVIKIRGSNAYEHIALLANEDFVEKKKEGRSFRLNLTAKFFKYFDVEGERDVKDALKDVKIPEEVPEKVGDMDVVNVPPGEVGEAEKIKEKLGDLEVVDETEEPEQDEEGEEKVSIENNKPDPDFLEHIEKRIDEVSKRNDEVDQDELFKRQEEVTKEFESQGDGEGEVKEEYPQEETKSESEEENTENLVKEQKEVVENATEKLEEITKELEQEKKEIEQIGKEEEPEEETEEAATEASSKAADSKNQEDFLKSEKDSDEKEKKSD